MKYFNSRSFLLAFFTMMVVCLVFVVGANLIVDPFYRFNLLTIPGINLQRYQFSSNVRMGKAGAICRVNPRTIIMGTSRAEIGLDPNHPGFKELPVYNMAMAGTGIQETRDTLNHAIYAAPNLKQAIIAIDFLMFNAYREEVLYKTEVFDFDPNRLLRNPRESCMKNFYYDAGTLIGFKGLRYVQETIKIQKKESEKAKISSVEQGAWWSALYDENGFRGNSFDIYSNLSANQGVMTFHKETYTQEDYFLTKIWRGGNAHRYCFVKQGQPNTLDVFKELITIARQKGLDVKFVINPIHVRMMVAIQEAGLWPQYEDWKRQLVKIIAEDAAKHQKSPYELWDFSGFNTITMEEIPVLGTGKLLKWFWEPSHYRKETGTMMLNKILGVTQTSTPIPADFGIILNQSNIEAWLTRTLKVGRAYINSHQREINKVRTHNASLFKDWEGANCGEDMQAVRDGSAAQRQGEMKLAKDFYARARKIHASNKKRALILGVPYRELAFERSLADAKLGKPIDELLGSWESYQKRGNLRVKNKDFEGAIADYTRALKDSPPNPALYFLRGSAKIQIKDFKGAKKDFLAGLKQDPNNVTLKNLLVHAEKLAKNKS